MKKLIILLALCGVVSGAAQSSKYDIADLDSLQTEWDSMSTQDKINFTKDLQDNEKLIKYHFQRDASIFKHIDWRDPEFTVKLTTAMRSRKAHK